MIYPIRTTCPSPQCREQFPVCNRMIASLCLSVSLALLAGGNPALAQTTTTAQPPPPEAPVVLETLVVTGVRASLISAQDIKKNSVQIVDSVVAQDIGKLPDNTVADALQRVPGIQVARDNGEVNTVVIRGLPNLGTTLNGHEIFTGTGRGVALQDIPAELVAGVDVYKTSAPDQIEGGIAGLIDIRLHRPFDFKGLELAGGGRASFSKYAEGTSWNGSALVSNHWKLSGGGEFGALLSVSNSRTHFKDQRVFNFLWEPVPSGGGAPPPTMLLPVTAGSLLIPGDRKRPAYNFSLQWRPNSELELYSDVLFTGYRHKRDVHFFIGFPRFGAFQTVTVNPGTSVVSSETTTNNFHLNSTQAFQDRTDSYQGVVGAKWSRDRLKVDSELVYNWSSFKGRAVIIDVQYVAPSTFFFDLNNPEGTNVNITGGNIRDAANFRLWGLFDNHNYQTSKQTSWKADADYELKEGGFLTNLKGGIRLSSRDARSRATSVNDIAPVGGRGVVSTTTIPGFGSLAPDGLFSASQFGASNWYSGDPDYQRDNIATLRPLFGRPAADPDFNPTQSFTDTEKTLGAYVQARYKMDVGGNPLEGLFGFRVVKTDQELAGNLATGAAVIADKGQTDILPVINGRLKLQDDVYFRFSAGRSVTRPNFSDLNPVVNLNSPTTTGGALGTGSGGNPDLETVTSDNFDLALEYYFDKSSYASVVGFYRSIEGYVQTFASTETIGGTGYIVTRPRNSGKGHLQGFEAAYTYFFDFLPDTFKGFGFQTNYTYIEGDTDAPDTSPGAAVGARVTQAYTNVSKNSYNLIGIYERGNFSARLAYNWRSGYIDTFNGPNAPGNPLRIIRIKATDRMDFSASYNWGKHLTVSLDATNLLNQKFQDYFGTDASLHPRDSRLFDRTIEVGVRYRY